MTALDLSALETAIGSAQIEQQIGSINEAPSTREELTGWIRGEVINLLMDKELSRSEKRSLISKTVVEALSKLGRFYFHEERRDFNSAMFFDAQRKRLEKIRSDAFSAWLSAWLNVNRADILFRFMLAEVETAALSSSYTTGITFRFHCDLLNDE